MPLVQLSGPTAKRVIDDISNNGIQISFASKLLHTFNNEIPIYDSIIRNFLQLARPQKVNRAKRLDAYVEQYKIVCDDLKYLMVNKKFDGLTQLFDKQFADAHGISKLKKIDFIIWACGRPKIKEIVH